MPYQRLMTAVLVLLGFLAILQALTRIWLATGSLTCGLLAALAVSSFLAGLAYWIRRTTHD